jgi:hypothetical protein
MAASSDSEITLRMSTSSTVTFLPGLNAIAVYWKKGLSLVTEWVGTSNSTLIQRSGINFVLLERGNKELTGDRAPASE